LALTYTSIVPTALKNFYKYVEEDSAHNAEYRRIVHEEGPSAATSLEQRSVLFSYLTLSPQASELLHLWDEEFSAKRSDSKYMEDPLASFLSLALFCSAQL
tara:strand:- start:534 stop:836 length:303 start_codon:yes stop_codon:yes gene_type:complete